MQKSTKIIINDFKNIIKPKVPKPIIKIDCSERYKIFYKHSKSKKKEIPKILP